METSTKATILIGVSSFAGAISIAYGQYYYWSYYFLIPAVAGILYGIVLGAKKDHRSIEDLIEEGYSDEQIATEYFHESSFLVRRIGYSHSIDYEQSLEQVRSARQALGKIEPNPHAVAKGLEKKSLLIASFLIFLASCLLASVVRIFFPVLGSVIFYGTGIFVLAAMIETLLKEVPYWQEKQNISYQPADVMGRDVGEPDIDYAPGGRSMAGKADKKTGKPTYTIKYIFWKFIGSIAGNNILYTIFMALPLIIFIAMICCFIVPNLRVFCALLFLAEMIAVRFWFCHASFSRDYTVSKRAIASFLEAGRFQEIQFDSKLATDSSVFGLFRRMRPDHSYISGEKELHVGRDMSRAQDDKPINFSPLLVVMRQPYERHLPQAAIVSRTFLESVGCWFYSGDVKSESNEFNHNYQMYAGKNEDTFYNFSPSLIELFNRKKYKFALAIEPTYFALSCSDRFSVQDLNDMWQLMDQIKELLPKQE